MAIDRKILLTPKAMGAVDAACIVSGIDGFGLMERAGATVAAAALKHWPELERAVILCGPGNNGGDGHVVARHLARAGVPILRFGDEPRSKDAIEALARFPGDVAPLDDYSPRAGDLVIDALFGAGLDRPVAKDVAQLIAGVEAMHIPVLAVDLPSGLSGRTGRPTGAHFKAARTVTFAALKPGHVLLPGRDICGAIELADIGTPARLITADVPLFINHPGLYVDALPTETASDHKYSRGALAVFSGPLVSASAARMTATAGLKAGAGLVTLLSPPGAVMAQAAHLTAVMQKPMASGEELEAFLDDMRFGAFVLGPGFGDVERARDYARQVAAQGRTLLLDADGLTAFAGRLDELVDLGGQCNVVLTPHEGEFHRLFPKIATDEALSKIERAQAAAEGVNAVIIYKGADTVIAAPDGRVAVNVDAPAWLATAGSGDVLAGIAGALLAQKMPAFEAACAAVAQHGCAAMRAGGSMTAEDLIAAL